MAKSEEKISEELDVITLINKIRLSSDVFNNLLGKRQKKMLKYQKSSIIDVDTSDSASSSDDSSSSGEEKRPDQYQQSAVFKDDFDSAIIAGIKISKEDKEKMKMQAVVEDKVADNIRDLMRKRHAEHA